MSLKKEEFNPKTSARKLDRTTRTNIDWDQENTLGRVVHNAASMGMEEDEIAQILGISKAQLKNKLGQLPKIEAELLEGQSEATCHVIGALYRTAIGGHTYTETKIKTTSKGAKSTETTIRTAPPSAVCQIFWLTNRDPSHWKHIKEVVKKEMTVLDATPEKDKIARLAKSILAHNPDKPKRKRRIQNKTARLPTPK